MLGLDKAGCCLWPRILHGPSCLHLGSNALPQTGIALRHVAQPDTAHLLQQIPGLVKDTEQLDSFCQPPAWHARGQGWA